jgi:hypothetical protein
VAHCILTWWKEVLGFPTCQGGGILPELPVISFSADARGDTLGNMALNQNTRKIRFVLKHFRAIIVSICFRTVISRINREGTAQKTHVSEEVSLCMCV